MKIIELLKRSDDKFRQNLWLFLASYFLVLFNYPLIRASSTTFFFEAFGAKSSPVAMLWSVLFLTGSILLCNKLQKRWSVQAVFLTASILSSFLFMAGSTGFLNGTPFAAYVPFIWKEIYIVIQVHLLLAYANNFFKKEDFKILLGLVGAAGSLGGTLGGLLTSYLSSTSGTPMVMWIGLSFVLIPAIIFFFTSSIRSKEEKVTESPLASLNTSNVKKYVFYIALVVALTQFIINIADFRFHIEFENAVTDSSLRTSYLGNIYTVTNFLTFLFQLFLVPFLLPRVSEKNYHLFIPLSYFICLGALSLGPAVGLLSISVLYTYFKAADYSLFSAGKEILYQPLTVKQKYGAKYLTDMLVYRSSKAVVALGLIYIQSAAILNGLMLGFLVLWMLLIMKIFKLQKSLFV